MTEDLLQRLYDELEGIGMQADEMAEALVRMQARVGEALATVRAVDRFVTEDSLPSEH